MNQTRYCKFKPHFGEKKIQLHYMDTDSFVLCVDTEDNKKVLKNLEDFFDISTLSGYHELFSDKNKEIFGNFKIETPKIIWIDEVFCLRSKLYALECGDINENKSKIVSKSYPKSTKSDEYKNCLDGGSINKNVIIMLLVHLFMKFIFKK